MSFYKQLQLMTNSTAAKAVTNSRAVEADTITADNLPLDFVKQYLRVDHDFDDVEILVSLKSARSYVKTYIKQPDDEPLDDGLIMPILALTAYFYENKSPQMKSTEKLDTIFGNVLDLHRREVLGEY